MHAGKIVPLAVFSLLSAMATAFATPVPVANPSFETLPAGGLNNGGCGIDCAYSTGLAIPGWTITGDSGQFQPGSNTLYFNSVPDGTTVAYINNGSISQIVSALAVAGQTYLLQVDLGFRKDVSDPGTVLLQVGSDSVSATGIPSQNSGDWATYTASWTATLADDGAAITIALASGSLQGDFDNVRLDIVDPLVSVSEPLTLSLFGVGLIGAATLRRRRIRRPG